MLRWLKIRFRVYEFVYEHILPHGPRTPRLDVWLLARGAVIQRRLADYD